MWSPNAGHPCAAPARAALTRRAGRLAGLGAGLAGRFAEASEELGGGARRVLALLGLTLLAHVHVLAHATLPGASGVRRHGAGLLSQPGGGDHSFDRSKAPKDRL